MHVGNEDLGNMFGLEFCSLQLDLSTLCTIYHCKESVEACILGMDELTPLGVIDIQHGGTTCSRE